MTKLLFSDIDGTLINTHLKVTPKTCAAIRKQITNGNIFIPVSARMPQAVMTVAGQITEKCPMVAYNGALVLDEMSQTLSSQYMAAEIAAEICSYIEKRNNKIAWNVYSGNSWYYSPGNSSFLVEKEEQIVKVKAKPTTALQIKELQGVHKILFMGESDQLEEVQRDIKQRYAELVLVKSAPNLLELMAKGVSKGRGIRIAAQHFGVDLQSCWAFGDNYNDETMLAVAGHPFLMGNAPSDLKKKFGNVTLDNDHDGIAEVLNRID